MANILQTLRRSDIEQTRHWADIIVLTLGRQQADSGQTPSDTRQTPSDTTVRHWAYTGQTTSGRHRADKTFVVKAGPEVLAS